MTTERLAGGAPSAAGPRVTQQVIHTIRPQLGWVGAAIIAMLVLQVCTTLLLAVRIGSPDSRAQQLAGREDAVKRLLGHVKVDPDGKLNVQSWIEEYQALRDEVSRRRKTDVLLEETAGWIEKGRKELEAEKDAEISRLKESKRELNEELQEEIGGLEADKQDLEERIAQLEKQLPKPKKDDAAEGDAAEDAPAEDGAPEERTWRYILAAACGLLFLVLMATLIIRMKVRRRRLS